MSQKLKPSTKEFIDSHDWDRFVEDTYEKPYCFQQQGGCQERGIYAIDVPAEADDFENETVPEMVNGDEMGVKFSAWLERDPKQLGGELESDSDLHLFWQRNFYPDIQMVANDLFEKGLIESGSYIINIDW